MWSVKTSEGIVIVNVIAADEGEVRRACIKRGISLTGCTIYAA